MSGTLQWTACANKYAEKEFTPVWIEKGIECLINDGEEALDFAMDTLTEFLRQNGNREVRTAKILYLNPASNSSMCSRNGDSELCVPLDIAINPESFNNVSGLNLTGSLFHAWTHRMGYSHPINVYTTYFSAEAAMCLMRSFQDKVPGTRLFINPIL